MPISTNEQRESWTNSSPHAGYANNQLSDDEMYDALAKHNLLWRHVITHYHTEQNCPIAVVGYNSISLAIELSQWGYPVTYLTDTLAGVQKAKRDCDIQAGFLKEFFWFNFTKNCPRVRVVVFVGVIDTMRDEEQIFGFLDIALRRSNEVVCSVSNNRDWKSLLESRYDVEGLVYPDNSTVLLRIYERNVTQSGKEMEERGKAFAQAKEATVLLQK